jgi:flagellar basal-body rod modification protein FlgD
MSDLSIPGVTTSGATGAARADTTGTQTLGQEDFLTLLTTQLKSQDPLSPMDNSAFVAQLAQFTTVSGITEMNAGIGRLATLLSDDSRNSAPAWLGRLVTGPDGVAARVERVVLEADGGMTLSLEGGGLLPVGDVSQVA